MQKRAKFAELRGLDFAKAAWLTSRGNHYAATGDLDAAISDYKEALGLKHDWAPAYVALATALQQKGLIAEAVDLLLKAPLQMTLLESTPLPVPAWVPDVTSMVYTALSRAHAAAGRFDDAIACLERAVEAAPTRAEITQSVPEAGVDLVDGALSRADVEVLLTEMKARRKCPREARAQRFLHSITSSPSELVERLTREIQHENRVLATLIRRHGRDPVAMAAVPELSDPSIVVPQMCKRQLANYLFSRLAGLSELDSLRSVLVSRFAATPGPLVTLTATDAERFLQSPKVSLPEVCKEILRRENPGTDSRIIESQVDKYFQSLSSGRRPA
jgi:tetratricopeptide (TPR) repeat protein